MSVQGATDGAAFETYVEHFLVPTLNKGQIVVMDNLQVHKSLERVMNLDENRIEMRIPQSAWFPRDLCFPHS
jgi:transposase